MSNKRSAVKPNVCKNVVEKLRGSITLEKKFGVICRGFRHIPVCIEVLFTSIDCEYCNEKYR
jgi:hypothetical protein